MVKSFNTAFVLHNKDYNPWIDKINEYKCETKIKQDVGDNLGIRVLDLQFV